MSWLRGFNLRNRPAYNLIFAKFFGENRQNLVHDFEAPEIILLLRFTYEIMLNPQIAIQKNVPWVKRKLGDSPDETAFFRWPLRRLLEQTGFHDVRIDPFDFLHPKTPIALINGLNSFGRFLEKVPVIAEFAGSLYIRAVK